MKKIVKYLFVVIFLFSCFKINIFATTIKETTLNGDSYDTIERNTTIIGITKFTSNEVITASKATKAGANDATLYMKKNNTIEGYETPVIYVYYGPVGGWYKLDEDNNATYIEDKELLSKLSNIDIYFVNNKEKIIEINVGNIDIDEEKLPEGVSLENNKLLVPATEQNVEIITTDNKKIYFAKDETGFIRNTQMCFIASEGFITGYNSECVMPEEIPDRINEDDIIGIRSNALSGSGLTRLIVPKGVINLEDNALSGLELDELIFMDKYDEEDFATLGTNAFGNNTPIYNNELTEALKYFNDELEIKVRNGMEFIPGYILTAAEAIEFERLGITPDSEGYVEGKSINYTYKYDESTQKYDRLTLVISNGTKTVEKTINYEIKYVDVEDDSHQNIKNEYNEYLAGLEEEFNKKNYKLSITDYDKYYDKYKEIANKYGYSVYLIGLGDGYDDEPELLKPTLVSGGCEFLIVKNGIIYETDDIDFYSYIMYALSIDEDYNDLDELKIKMLNKYNELLDANLSQDSIMNSYLTTNANGKEFFVDIKDNYDNSWQLVTKIPAEPGELVLTRESHYNDKTYLSKTYYPIAQLENFDTINEYVSEVVSELKTLENLDNSIYVSDVREYHHDTKPNKEGKYVSTYYFSVSKSEENLTVNYTISFNLSYDSPMTEEYYVADISSDAGVDSYIKDTSINSLLSEYEITKYAFSGGTRYAVKNSQDKYDLYYEKPNTEDELFYAHQVIDLTNNKSWYVIVPISIYGAGNYINNDFYVTLDQSYETDEEYYDAMLSNFEQETGITNYNVQYKYVNGTNGKGVKYNIGIFYNGIYRNIYYTVDYVVGNINTYSDSNSNFTHNIYLPVANYKDYYGNTNEYIEVITNELKQKIGVSEINMYSVDMRSINILVQYDKREVEYAVYYHCSENNQYYEIYFYAPYSNPSFGETEIIDDVYSGSTYEEANELAYNSVIESRNITDYNKRTPNDDTDLFAINEQTGEFEFVYDEYKDQYDILYHRLELVDFSNGKEITIYRRIK